MATRRMPRPKGYHWDQREPYVHPLTGRPSCRWCKGPVDAPRRSWCGDPGCWFEWSRRTSWALTRLAVYDRDKGRCAGCGVDTERVMARFRQVVCDRLGYDRARASLDNVALAHTVRVSKRRYRTVVVKPEPLPADLVAAYAAKVGWPPCVFRPKAHAWEVDHILPVSSGGDWFAMSNLQTLCPVCHRVKTNADGKARKARRAAS